MAHMQYIAGDPRLVDQLVYELKSKGIFDQFRKDCIADVDTKPAYQNLRQRVENSVSTFLARQCWKPDLNKNQLREKLRKHILEGNYLEQGVERIVDQVVNPKVASVFIPQVEDLVYNYLGIARKKSTPAAETSNGKVNDNNLLPTDLEAVSPGSVKSNDDKNEELDITEDGQDTKMETDQEYKVPSELKSINAISEVDTQSAVNEPFNSSGDCVDKSTIPLPEEEIKLENIPEPENSPPKTTDIKIELDKIKLPEPTISMDIPLPDEIGKTEKEQYFKPINSDEDDSSSDSSLRRNMSPLTPIRNFNNENSCDAQQAFENDSVDSKSDKKEVLEPNTFRFTIEAKNENSVDAIKPEKKDTEQINLSYQFSNQVNINTFSTPMYDDSSNSNMLQIDYESDANSKLNIEKLAEADQNSDEIKKDKKQEEKKISHKSSHRDRDSRRHSSTKDRRSDYKQPSSRDSKEDRKSSKDDNNKSTSKSSHKERSSDRSDRKDSRDSSKHRSSHKSSSHRDSKSHRNSSSSQKYSSSSKHTDEKKSSSSRDKEKSSKDDKYSKDKSSKDSKRNSSSHRSDKDRKSSSNNKSKSDDKEKKKEKKETDDHYSASGRGNHSRRSTDRDSNDGSSSSKGSQNPSSAKSSESKKEGKCSTSKSDNTSTSGGSASPSDKDVLVNELQSSRSINFPQGKPVIRVENHLETPIASPPRLPFVPDVTLKKPKIAANMQEARKLMKMRKFLDDEQKRMNQEAALLLEFQANVRPSLSQVYSSISGPELEFACVTSTPPETQVGESQTLSEHDSISDILNAAEQVESIEVTTNIDTDMNKKTTINKTEKDVEVNEIRDKATVQIVTDANLVEMNNDVVVDCKDLTVDVTKSEPISENKERNSTQNENVIVIKKSAKDLRDTELEIDNSATDKIAKGSGIERNSETKLDDKPDKKTKQAKKDTKSLPYERDFKYFEEHEKFSAELERDNFGRFLKTFTEQCTKNLFLINCDSYEENIVREASQTFGTFGVVNYFKNGHLKLNKSKNIVKNINVANEISLPLDSSNSRILTTPPLVFSPAKSECSFELSSDYDAKLEEMVSKTSRKEIMEIILGNATESTTDLEMPTIDYCNESHIECSPENTMKRRFCEVESSENNNSRKVLTPNKIRKISESDQITSTTGETEVTSNNNMTMNTPTVRSKYLGKARRVGLPRPRRSNLPNSPSSDKSIENYEQNTPVLPVANGKIKTQRSKVQRYDTSDLYKPKLHYLSKRNNIS